jgi:hypothetical protein
MALEGPLAASPSPLPLSIKGASHAMESLPTRARPLSLTLLALASAPSNAVAGASSSVQHPARALSDVEDPCPASLARLTPLSSYLHSPAHKPASPRLKTTRNNFMYFQNHFLI